MNNLTSYSLWLMPNKQSDLYKKLKDQILNLSRRFNTPFFEPHVTLLGDIETTEEDIIAKTEELAKLIKPYKITLDFIDYTDYLFQSLVIRTVANPDVIEANKKARDVFNKHKGTLYVPHVSLMYIEGLDNKTKQEIVKEIEDKFNEEQFIAGSIQIANSGVSGETPRRIEDWKIIKEVPLNG